MTDILQAIAIVLLGFVSLSHSKQIAKLERKHFNLFAMIHDHILNKERHVNEE